MSDHEGEIRDVTEGIYVTGFYGACTTCQWVAEHVRATRGLALTDYIDHTKEATA